MAKAFVSGSVVGNRAYALPVSHPADHTAVISNPQEVSNVSALLRHSLLTMVVILITGALAPALPAIVQARHRR